MYVELLNTEKYTLWNNFVDESAQGEMFCYTWWLETITKQKFKIYILFENGKIIAGMPLAYDSENMINMPPLTRTLGVLYSNRDFNSLQKQSSTERKYITELVKYLPVEDLLQMYLHHNVTDWLPLRWTGLSQTTRYTYIIDYENQNIDDLWGRLNRGRKESIRRAYKNSIHVEPVDDFDLVYKFTKQSFERQGLKFQVPYEDLYKLDENIKRFGNRLILRAMDNTKAVHAVLYVTFNHKSAFALLSGSDASLRKYGGHTLVMWEAVKYFIDKVKYFNLGGSDMESIENHLRGFGGVLTPYFHIYNPRLLLKNESMKFHIDEIIFHLRSILEKIPKKVFKYATRD